MRSNNYLPRLHHTILFIAFLAIACRSSPELVFDKMVGTWKIGTTDGFEIWTKKPDGSFQSAGITVNGKDTSWNENTRVYPEAGNWIFETTVKGQNDGKAVKFIASVLTGKSVQFSNPTHDFPTDINYSFVDNNRIHAFIFGPNDKGGKDTIHFEFTRVK
jgi:hypothetical protein